MLGEEGYDLTEVWDEVVHDSEIVLFDTRDGQRKLLIDGEQFIMDGYMPPEVTKLLSERSLPHQIVPHELKEVIK